jgi:hypothetical protein
VFTLAAGVVGAALARALSRWSAPSSAEARGGDAAELLDRLCAAMVLALAAACATSWGLALAHALRPIPLVIAALVEAVVAGAWLVRTRDRTPRVYAAPGRATLAIVALALGPVVLWTAFVAWRGTLLPVYNHDALAYHLPKAVLLAKAGRFAFFDVPEARIASWPCNYELFLADTMILTRGDRLTAAVGTLSYVLFIAFAARMAAAWWGGGAHVALVAAAVATAPLVVLHSGLHKNDLLLGVFALGAFAWGARWAAAGDRGAAVLSAVSLAMAVGTKVNAAFVVVGVVPLLVLGAARARVGSRWAIGFVLAAAAASLLLGSAAYVTNLATIHRLFLPPAVGLSAGQYGAWSNIWQYTVMVLIAPFSSTPFAVWNPFHGGYWWWPANDIWMSHFGALISILAVLLGPCVWRYRWVGPGARERTLASFGVLGAYLLTLPMKDHPAGFFATYSRYVVYVVPFVAAWTVSPIARELELRAGRATGRLDLAAAGVPLVMAIGVAVFGVASFWEYGVHDAYAPVGWIAYEMEHPDDRTPFVRRNRAANLFDAHAKLDDVCAIDVGFDTWVYPAYGPSWTRTVEYLRPTAGEVTIPDEANWVIVDRTWTVFFGHPSFVDMGQAQYLGHGKPSAEDLKVYRQMRRDPRFELVYDDREQNQALFRRKGRKSVDVN